MKFRIKACSIPATETHYGGFSLREFQSAIVEEYFAKPRKSTCIVAGMGAGKTITFGAIAWHYKQRGDRVAFCFDLGVLPEQAKADIEKLGVNCSIFQAGSDYDPSCDVALIMLQTLESQIRSGIDLDLGDFAMFALDEAHDTVSRQGFSWLLEQYPKAQIIGLTATPYRLKKKEYLGLWFDDLIQGPQPTKLIKQKIILQERAFMPSIGQIVMKDLKTQAGEYSIASQEQQVLTTYSLESVVESYMKICPGVPAAVYCVSIEQAKRLCEAFNDRFKRTDGFTQFDCAWQSGSTSMRDRHAQFQSMRDYKTLVICSVGTMAKGFDLDVIGATLFARATKSRALFNQCVGRAGRPLKKAHPAYPNGKNFYYLLTFSDALQQFGHPSDLQLYDISQKTSQESPRPMIKVCPDCDYVCRSFDCICSNCGYTFSEGKEKKIVDAHLIEVFGETATVAYHGLQLLRRKAYQGTIRLREVERLFEAQFSWPPPDAWAKGAVFGDNPTDTNKRNYAEYLAVNLSTWEERYRQFALEFGDVEDAVIEKAFERRRGNILRVLTVYLEHKKEVPVFVVIKAVKAWKPADIQKQLSEMARSGVVKIFQDDQGVRWVRWNHQVDQEGSEESETRNQYILSLAKYVKEKGQLSVNEIKKNWGRNKGFSAAEIDGFLITLITLGHVDTFTPDRSRGGWVEWTGE